MKDRKHCDTLIKIIIKIPGGICLFLGIILVVSLVYKLELLYIFMLLLLAGFLYPSLIKARKLGRVEEKRFLDVCSYMEQLCSSFQKDGKILNALKDTSQISDGHLKTLIEEAVVYVERGVDTNGNIYREAFDIIEKEYFCKRMNSLHEFMIKVELSGGDFHTSLNIILKDLHLWMERTILFQKNIAVTKVNYVLVLFLSIVSCTMATILSTISNSQTASLSMFLDITGSPLYQAMTALFILSCIASIILIYKKLTGSWLDQYKSEKLILNDYEISMHYNPKKALNKIIPWIIIPALTAGVLFLFEKYWAIIICLVVCIFILNIPNIKLKIARKNTIEEIKMAFPEWLREITLNVQYQTIQMAIQYSHDNTPIVLKEPIQKLISGLDKNPKGIEPYHIFLSEFDISDIKSAMRILYSMSELSHNKSQEMLQVLTERNYVMIDKAEKIYDKNRLATIKQLLYVPMIFSMCKIFVDLMLFSNSFFSGFSQIGNFIQ